MESNDLLAALGEICRPADPHARHRITLVPMHRESICPDCNDMGEILVSQDRDGGEHWERCRPCRGTGRVANPDFDADALVCPCGNPLLVGDSCRQCGAER